MGEDPASHWPSDSADTGDDEEQIENRMRSSLRLAVIGVIVLSIGPGLWAGVPPDARVALLVIVWLVALYAAAGSLGRLAIFGVRRLFGWMLGPLPDDEPAAVNPESIADRDPSEGR